MRTWWLAPPRCPAPRKPPGSKTVRVSILLTPCAPSGSKRKSISICSLPAALRMGARYAACSRAPSGSLQSDSLPGDRSQNPSVSGPTHGVARDRPSPSSWVGARPFACPEGDHKGSRLLSSGVGHGLTCPQATTRDRPYFAAKALCTSHEIARGPGQGAAAGRIRAPARM